MRSNLSQISVLVALCSAIALSSPVAAEVSTAKDLFVVITLQGKPCGKVVEHNKRGENDYEVSCETGDRYRVYVKDGRAVVEKL